MKGFGSILYDYLEYHRITQTEFADRLGISVKHMNEIINGNTNISPELMIAISILTDIDINTIFFVEHKKIIYDRLLEKYKSDDGINQFLKGFYLKEMQKKKWITLRDSTSVAQNAVDLLKFLELKDFDVYENYVDKRIIYKKMDSADQRKIYLWIRHCDNLISDIKAVPYSSSNLQKLLNELKKERMRNFDKERLVKIFLKYGIILCIEDALEGSKIRGCAMVKHKTPVIYLTTYFKEKSSFYFTLYHELGHIKKNYNKLINKVVELDEDEKDADIFSLNQMIPSAVWELIKNNKEKREKICLDNDIPFCFLYSRLAYEGLISYSSREYNDHMEKISI